MGEENQGNDTTFLKEIYKKRKTHTYTVREVYKFGVSINWKDDDGETHPLEEV